MKRHALLTAAVMALGLAASAVHAAGTGSTSDSSNNRATPATAYPGQGEAATPAMPGNATAQAKVTANRKKEEQLRLAAAQRAAAAKQNGSKGLDRASVERPSISRPDINRPEIQR